MTKKSKLTLILLGTVTGFLNGFFGGGGGMVVVPMLTHFIKLNEKSAHATAIAVILPTTIVSAVISILKNNFELSVGLPCLIGVFIGGIIGAFLLKKMSAKTLKKVFYITMFIAGVKMLVF